MEYALIVSTTERSCTERSTAVRPNGVSRFCRALLPALYGKRHRYSGSYMTFTASLAHATLSHKDEGIAQLYQCHLNTSSCASILTTIKRLN